MSQSHSYMSGRDLLKPEIMLIVLVFTDLAEVWIELHCR